MPHFLTQKTCSSPPRVVARRVLAIVVAVAGLSPLWDHLHGHLQPLDILIRLGVAVGGMCGALVLWRRARGHGGLRGHADSTMSVPSDDGPHGGAGHLALWLAGAGVAILLGAAVWTQYQAAAL